MIGAHGSVTLINIVNTDRKRYYLSVSSTKNISEEREKEKKLRENRHTI
jgi:hypothetical protein